MKLQSLGYVGLRARNLEDWASFGEKFLGMQLVERSRSALRLRMDDRSQRLLVEADATEGAGFLGWEVTDSAALEKLAARLEAAGVRVERGTKAFADARRIKELIRFADPAAAGPRDLRLPHRASRHGPRRAHGRAHRGLAVVLSGRARAAPERLYARAVQDLFLPRQSAPPQLRDAGDRKKRHAPSHGGALHARRRRPGL